ncbi:MAG TPA: hypothetical protein VFT79_12845 [Solirubrobacterales bacterium]|nr:hypothetical protein [Solirubrobacterales bacterium]
MAERAKNKAPSGELDLGLKLAMRRVFWGMNYATRLNLVLALPGSRRTADELSDLDCVGFSVGGDFSIRLLVADCKSGSKVSPASRLFWLAGVRDFFGADRAYAVLLREIPDGVRQQAGRLGVDVLGDADRQIMENVHGSLAPAAPFFELEGAAKLQQLARGLDRRLDRLVRFRDHEYWHLAPERRLQRLIAALREAGPALDMRQRAHAVLLIDLLFLLTLSLFGACRYVSSISLSDPRRALLHYLLGGHEQARSREQSLEVLIGALSTLSERGVEIPSEALEGASVEPPYFDSLAEVVARMLRRPRDAQRLLRYFEWWGQAQIGLGAPSVEDALGPAYGEYTRKLASDIVRMCFGAAGLDKEWLTLVTGAVDSQETKEKSLQSKSNSPVGEATQLPLER